MSWSSKSQLKYVGQWPDGSVSAHQPELTVAARRLAESVLDDLSRSSVVVTLDKSGRAHFRSTYTPSRDARRMIERHGDLIESFLLERGPRRLSLNRLAMNHGEAGAFAAPLARPLHPRTTTMGEKTWHRVDRQHIQPGAGMHPG